MTRSTDGVIGPCPICAATGKRAVVYSLTRFDVVECALCGSLQRSPLPTAAEMESYYSDPGYIEGGYFAEREGPETAIFREALAWLASRRRERASAAASSTAASSTAAASTAAGSAASGAAAAGEGDGGRLLDVGAGSGAFLAMARRKGWEADGIELSPELAARAAERSGARVVQGDFISADLPAASYDAVTMWDVLEHTADPGAFLDRARSLLAPGGVLVVFTIDAASLFNVVADLAWRLSLHRVVSPLELLYDKRHNHYFTARTLALLLSRHGFAIEEATAHRAHLGRWLSEPASRTVLAGAELVDLVSVPLGRPYRQLLYGVAS